MGIQFLLFADGFARSYVVNGSNIPSKKTFYSLKDLVFQDNSLSLFSFIPTGKTWTRLAERCGCITEPTGSSAKTQGSPTLTTCSSGSRCTISRCTWHGFKEEQGALLYIMLIL